MKKQKKYPLYRENKKTINILCIDDDYSNGITFKYCTDFLKPEHKKYKINFFHAYDNKSAVRAMRKMKNIHILTTDQNRANGNNADLHKSLKSHGLYPIKILITALANLGDNPRYIKIMHKPIKFTDYPKEISPIINFVKLVKKYEKKSKFSFAEIMAAIPDYVIELGLDNVTNYFENNKFNYYKNKMITNSLTKRIKHKKISKTDLNRAWWDRLSSNWQNLLLKNYELQPMFKTWFHPYFSYYPISIYSLHETETPIYDEPISDKLIAKIKEIRFLDCKYMHIKNLIPIKGFEKLEYLDCSHNELKNLDAIKNLKNLKHLNSCFCPYLKNIEGISDLKGLQIMILHDLPTLKRTTIPSTFNQIKILSVGSSPIEFTQETAENIIELCIREINLPLYNYKKLDIMKLTKEEDDAEIFSSETFLTIKTNRDTEIQQRKVSIFDGLRSMGINENDMLELMLAFKNKIWDSLNFSRVENIFKKYEDPNAKSLWVDGGDCPPMDVMEYDKEK